MTTSPRDRLLARPTAVAAASLLIAAVLAGVIAVAVFQVRPSTLRVPFAYDSKIDALFYEMTVKSIAEDGSLSQVDRLGAPDSLDLRDYPMGADNLNHAVIRLLALFSGDWRLLVNLFFLLTFPLAAITGAAVARSMRMRWSLAAVVGVLFAFAPFHLIRSQSHLFLSAIYGVPLGCWLALEVLRRRDPTEAAARARWRTAAVIAAVVIVGSTGIYFAVFALALIAGAGLLAAATGGGRRSLLRAGAVVGGVMTVVVVNLLPSILYILDEGRNRLAGSRSAAESEELGFRFADLLLPIDGHRFGPLRAMREAYERVPAAGGPEPATVGLIAAIGIIGVLAVLLERAVAVRNVTPAVAETERPSTGEPVFLGALTLIALFVGVTGGLGTLFAVLISPQVRGWNRISIHLTFLGIAGVALAVDRLLTRVEPEGAPTRLLTRIAVAGALLAVGLFDQVPPQAWRTDPARAEAAFAADRGFTQAVDEALPENASVVQLPHVDFPESPPVSGLGDYEHLVGYLHSDDLHFSYGGMKGRPYDWSASFADSDVSVVATAAVLADFDAIWVDRRGYADGGSAVISALTAELDAPDVTDQWRELFRLDDLVAAVDAATTDDEERRLGELVLSPVAVLPRDGVHQPESDGVTRWRWARQTSAIELANPLSRSRDVLLSFDLSTVAPGSYATSVRLENEDGASVDVAIEVAADRSRFERVVSLPPGMSVLTLTTTAPEIVAAGDTRRLALRISGLRAVDVGVEALAASVFGAPDGPESP